MPSLFAGIHLQDKTNEFLPLNDIDFERNVNYLKEEIAKKLQYDATNLELIFNGITLKDDSKLLDSIRPNATVHCFTKTKQNAPYMPPEDVSSPANINRIYELFNVIAHAQINVNSRVNVLQKVLTEYPEFRRNLGAQALIRDSVLFNTLHHPQVVKSISETYPIICEAAAFMVDTIKKELAKSSTTTLSEPATDSTNSSEEENSMGAASTSNERTTDTTAQSENGRIRLISRRQLEAALSRIENGSDNSLSNIAQRNSDAITPSTGTPPFNFNASTPLPQSPRGGDGIASQMFRTHLQRALDSMLTPNDNGSVGGSGGSSASLPNANVQQQSQQQYQQQQQQHQQMDTTESSGPSHIETLSAEANELDELPQEYRSHEYASQLRTMAQMGLLNYEDNIAYLSIASGNIENAVNLLMGGMN